MFKTPDGLEALVALVLPQVPWTDLEVIDARVEVPAHGTEVEVVRAFKSSVDIHTGRKAAVDFQPRFDGEIGARCAVEFDGDFGTDVACLLYTSPSPRDATLSRMPSSA